MQENQLARHAADPRQTRALSERWMVSGGAGVDGGREVRELREDDCAMHLPKELNQHRRNQGYQATTERGPWRVHPPVKSDR